MEHMSTRRDRKERTEKGAAAQIDFVAASNSLNMTQPAIFGHTDTSSDHFLVHAEFSDPWPSCENKERESHENLPPELVPDCLLVRSVSI